MARKVWTNVDSLTPAQLNAIANPKYGGIDADGYTTAFKYGGLIASPANGELVVDAALGNYFEITGTNAISKITVTNSTGGTHLVLKAVSTGLVITNDAGTGFIVTGTGANISMNAGDVILLVEYAAGKWVCMTRPAQPALLGSTSGNILRKAVFQITKHATGGINVQAQNNVGRFFNASGNISTASSGNIAKGGSVTVGAGANAVTYSLNAAGTIVTVNLVEDVAAIISGTMDINDSGAALIVQPSTAEFNIVISPTNSTTGAAVDMTAWTAGTGFIYHVNYVVGGAA